MNAGGPKPPVRLHAPDLPTAHRGGFLLPVKTTYVVVRLIYKAMPIDIDKARPNNTPMPQTKR